MSGLKLKLKTNNLDASGVPSARTPGTLPPATSIPATPGSVVQTPGGSLKIKLKFGGSSNRATPVSATPQPSQPDAPQPKKTKAGRQPKASQKVVESRKRKDHNDTDDEDSTIQVVSAKPVTKKIKISASRSAGVQTPSTLAPKTPIIRTKVKGEKPKRNPGEGYDSEAEDREEDPAIEEQFILRMHPGPDCDYLRQAITAKTIGTSRNLGGPDVSMKFYHADGRRGSITINGHIYATTIVDLPCIIEGMKSWDKRGWWKSADICQMLWAFREVGSEEEAQHTPLPQSIDQKTFQYPHGITPPMRFARKRRFRKRISRSAIEAVEEAVEALLRQDKQCVQDGGSFIYQKIDRERSVASQGSAEDEEEEDAEGEEEEIDYFNNNHYDEQDEGSADDADLQADFDAEMAEIGFEQSSVAATPASYNDATPMVDNMPAAGEDQGEAIASVSSGDDSDEDDGSDDEQLSEEELKQRQLVLGAQEELAEREKELAEAEANRALSHSGAMITRLDKKIASLKTSREVARIKLEDALSGKE
ncbi:TAFII55 protein conserved region-domain-containing protein [Calycina marina]|uniref:TAFII55 protein conserved region-domain-containing protein n=1 Tax=Calycina marina TaxID=1763456 RepID=A0A9P8CDI3_9HELO|nr:TAFII55 protein conserved region-domain-containing protein [Calycina marina]